MIRVTRDFVALLFITGFMEALPSWARFWALLGTGTEDGLFFGAKDTNCYNALLVGTLEFTMLIPSPK